jgi:hypothetical protein
MIDHAIDELLEGKECENPKEKAYFVLRRIVWLNKNGVAFTFDFEQEKKSLKNICPKWRDENIKEIDKLESSIPFNSLKSSLFVIEKVSPELNLSISFIFSSLHFGQIFFRLFFSCSKSKVNATPFLFNVFKVISSHQSEYNDWALELYLNCIVYSNEGFQQKIANKTIRCNTK